MYKKTQVRRIIELLTEGMSARDIAVILSVSRNTVADVLESFEQSGKSWNDISDWSDEMLFTTACSSDFNPLLFSLNGV